MPESSLNFQFTHLRRYDTERDMKINALLLLLLPLMAFGSTWEDQVAPSVAENQSQEAGVVEVTLTAKETEIDLGDRKVKGYTYNGVLPGPTIEAKVGDLLIVHFYNALKEPTTLHWHGVDELQHNVLINRFE